MQFLCELVPHSRHLNWTKCCLPNFSVFTSEHWKSSRTLIIGKTKNHLREYYWIENVYSAAFKSCPLLFKQKLVRDQHKARFHYVVFSNENAEKFSNEANPMWNRFTFTRKGKHTHTHNHTYHAKSCKSRRSLSHTYTRTNHCSTSMETSIAYFRTDRIHLSRFSL